MNLLKKELEKWDKEDLVQTLIIRNNDAKDYEKYICKLEKEIKKLSKLKKK